MNDSVVRPVLKNEFYLFEGLFFGAFSFILFNLDTFFYNTSFLVFQGRDIFRATELINGNPIFFGPELTGGGNLPGPFYYFVLAAGLLFNSSWVSAYYVMTFLAACAGSLVWIYLRKTISKEESLIAAGLWGILFTFSFTLNSILVSFYNPSYSIFFIALFFILTLQAFAKEKNSTYLYSASFVSSLSLHFHFSNLSLFAGLLFLMLFSSRLNLNKYSNTEISKAILCFLVPLLPYLTWFSMCFAGHCYGQQMGYSGQVKNSLGSLLAYIPYGLKNELPQYLLELVIRYAPFLNIFCIYLLFQKQSKPNKEITLLKYFCIFTVIPFLLLTIVPQGRRYGNPFFINFILLSCYLFVAFIKDFKKFEKKHWLLVGVLVLNLLTTVWDFYENSIFNLENILIHRKVISNSLPLVLLTYVVLGLSHFKMPKKLLVTLSLLVATSFYSAQNMSLSHLSSHSRIIKLIEKKMIWEYIHENTGWSYFEAQSKVFVVNNHVENEFELPFSLIKLQDSKDTFLGPMPDGFFVAVDYEFSGKIKEWILQQNIPQELREGLASDLIKIEPGFLNNNVLVAPYFIQDKSRLPSHIHNIGLGYRNLSEITPLDLVPSNNSQSFGSEKISENEFVLKWNICENKSGLCDIGATIEIINNKNSGAQNIKIKLLGNPISQTSTWITPGITGHLVRPQLKIICGQKVEVRTLISFIGYSRDYDIRDPMFNFTSRNNSWIAPMERNLTTNCSDKIDEIIMSAEKLVLHHEPGEEQRDLPEIKIKI